ncbi:hypothetical protein HZS_6995 [Henneguya salminicola]|nr:hypothetical protein HZS_6995 [Henneguya salminicola]
MINEHSFYEKDFDLEKYIENSVKLNELELIRVDLEKCYKNIKNTATSTTGENIEKFFNLENKEFRADFDDILIELKDTNTKIAAMLNDTNEEINKINDILHQQHAITDEKNLDKCLFQLSFLYLYIKMNNIKFICLAIPNLTRIIITFI